MIVELLLRDLIKRTGNGLVKLPVELCKEHTYVVISDPFGSGWKFFEEAYADHIIYKSCLARNLPHYGELRNRLYILEVPE
jgi:hypothetical protein